MDNAVTPKEFAKWLKAVGDMREGSYDPDGGERMLSDPTRSYGKYNKSYQECAEEVVPEVWWPIFDCLLTAGYCEMWDWAEKQLTE